MATGTGQIILKEAGFKDIDTIREVMFQIWPQTYAPIISDEQIAYMVSWMYSPEALQQQMKDGHHFWIILKDGIPCGYGSFSRTDNWHTYKIHKLYVLKNEQHGGLGTALLNKFMQIIKSDHGKFVQLQVNRKNSVAISFYKKHGFVLIKEVDFDIGNGYLMNDYILQKNL